MQTFRTYQLAKELARSCQNLKLVGPKADQFERAVLSIALNLAEGSARPSERDRKRFYFIALGSLREVQTLLDLYGTQELIAKADQLGASLYRLCHGHRH